MPTNLASRCTARLFYSVVHVCFCRAAATLVYLESFLEGVHVRATPHNANLPGLTSDLLPLNGVDLRVSYRVLARPLRWLISQRQHNLQACVHDSTAGSQH